MSKWKPPEVLQIRSQSRWKMPGDVRTQVLERDMYKCWYCGDEGDTVDHWIPLCRGGTNAMVNLVCACSSCNELKGNCMPDDFLAMTEATTSWTWRWKKPRTRITRNIKKTRLLLCSSVFLKKSFTEEQENVQNDNDNNGCQEWQRLILTVPVSKILRMLSFRMVRSFGSSDEKVLSSWWILWTACRSRKKTPQSFWVNDYKKTGISEFKRSWKYSTRILRGWTSVKRIVKAARNANGVTISTSRN